MKKYLFPLFFLLAFFVSLGAAGQDLRESEVPLVVRNSLKEKYPDVYVYEWEWKRKKMLYEAEFVMKGFKYEALFTKDGQWVKTERDIKRAEVPQAVWQSFDRSEYASWYIDDIEEHSTPQHSLMYEIEVKAHKRKVYLYYLPDGTLIDTYRK